MDNLRLAIAALAVFSVLGSLPVAQAGGGGAGGGGSGRGGGGSASRGSASTAPSGGASHGSTSTAQGSATRSPNTGGSTPVAPTTGGDASGSTQTGTASQPVPSPRPQHPVPKTANDSEGSQPMQKAVMGPCHRTDRTDNSQTDSSATPAKQESSADKRSSDCVT
jgi:hypothetical protein